MKHRKVAYLEDFDAHWNFTSFKDKVILDMGADFGMTPSWFFEKGARKVIAVEKANQNYEQLVQNFGDDPDVICIHKYVQTSEDLTNLLTKYPSDIVKMDIEGAEFELIHVSPELIQKVNIWLIEYHGYDVRDTLQTLFEKLGYNIEKYLERQNCGVFHIFKKE